MKRKTISINNYKKDDTSRWSGEISNVTFEGEGKIPFDHQHLIIENCDLSILCHITLESISTVEVRGFITMGNLQEIEQFIPLNLNDLTVNVDQTDDAIILKLFQMFECHSVSLESWTVSQFNIHIPADVEFVQVTTTDCSNLQRLYVDKKTSLIFDALWFDADCNLNNIQSREIDYTDCMFFDHSIEYNRNLRILHFAHCLFNYDFGDRRLIIPSSLLVLKLYRNDQLRLEMIKFQECKLLEFSFEDIDEIDFRRGQRIPNFANLEPITASVRFGIRLEIISKRIESISNLRIIGHVSAIDFRYYRQNVRSFTDNFDQFRNFELMLSPNPNFRVATELMNHFQNTQVSFSDYQINLPREDFPGQRFQQYLPFLTRFANHRVRNNLMILNQGRMIRNNTSAIRNLPRELRMMIGSFLIRTPDSIRELDNQGLIRLFGRRMLEHYVRH